MRKKLNSQDKRTSLIGIKVKEETKEKIKFISDREDRPMSSQINTILESYVENYFRIYNINWDEFAPSKREKK